jgi:hypothetical protein
VIFIQAYEHTHTAVVLAYPQRRTHLEGDHGNYRSRCRMIHRSPDIVLVVHVPPLLLCVPPLVHCAYHRDRTFTGRDFLTRGLVPLDGS